MEEIEQVESTQNTDVSQESSSESQESTENVQASQVSEAGQQQPADVPFHEHPRFKELIEQKNQAIEAQKAYEKRMAQLESQLQQLSRPKDPSQDERQELLKRLEGIDPAFGKLIAELAPATRELQELKAWKEQMDLQNIRTQAVSTVNDLHTQHKVSDEMKQIINAQLQAMDAQGLIKGVQDVPRAYKEVHDQLAKYEESIRRAVTASYAKDKTAAAKTPTSQPKGAPVKASGNKTQFNTRDREAGLHQVVSQYLKSKSQNNDF